MKTPGEIKRGLECCVNPYRGGCYRCPYNVGSASCVDSLLRDALSRIECLETECQHVIIRLKLSEITIPEKFLRTSPSQQKLADCRKFFETHAELDRELVVDEDNVLTDGYVGYLILCENGISECDVVRRPSSYLVIAAKHPSREKVYYWRTNKHTRHPECLLPGALAWVNTCYGRKVVEVVETFTQAAAPRQGPLRTVVCALVQPAKGEK